VKVQTFRVLIVGVGLVLVLAILFVLAFFARGKGGGIRFLVVVLVVLVVCVDGDLFWFFAADVGFLHHDAADVVAVALFFGLLLVGVSESQEVARQTCTLCICTCVHLLHIM
jgi:hypothetical protein